jgi:hypothetical protein
MATKGRRGNNFTFFTEDFRRLPRNADEAISGIFRGGVTKAGGEKIGKEGKIISASTLRVTFVFDLLTLA